MFCECYAMHCLCNLDTVNYVYTQCGAVYTHWQQGLWCRQVVVDLCHMRGMHIGHCYVLPGFKCLNYSTDCKVILVSSAQFRRSFSPFYNRLSGQVWFGVIVGSLSELWHQGAWGGLHPREAARDGQRGMERDMSTCYWPCCLCLWTCVCHSCCYCHYTEPTVLCSSPALAADYLALHQTLGALTKFIIL